MASSAWSSGSWADRSGRHQDGQPQKGRRRGKEPAWHRRARQQRSNGRLAARLAAACLGLCQHHGSRPPRLVAEALGQKTLAPLRDVPATLQQALLRWGVPAAPEEEVVRAQAAEASAAEQEEEAKAAEASLCSKLAEAASATEEVAAAAAQLEEARRVLSEAVRVAGRDAAIVAAEDAESRGVCLADARAAWRQARQDAKLRAKAGPARDAVVAAREELGEAQFAERRAAQAAEEARAAVAAKKFLR